MSQIMILIGYLCGRELDVLRRFLPIYGQSGNPFAFKCKIFLVSFRQMFMKLFGQRVHNQVQGLYSLFS